MDLVVSDERAADMQFGSWIKIPQDSSVTFRALKMLLQCSLAWSFIWASIITIWTSKQFVVCCCFTLVSEVCCAEPLDFVVYRIYLVKRRTCNSRRTWGVPRPILKLRIATSFSQIVAAPIFDTKVIVAVAFNQVNTVILFVYILVKYDIILCYIILIQKTCC